MKDLSSTLKEITKKYGAGAVMTLDANNLEPIECTSTGVLAVDLALGGKGLPNGRIIELYGPQMAGKSTLALFCVAEQQKKFPEKMTAYIDMEQALDPVLAATYGVDISKMLISQPMTGEEALDITEALVRSAGVSCIVVDSVAALLPTAEDENDMSQVTIGLQARLMSKALRKLTPIAAETGTTIIFINQIREKVGSYGN